MEITKQEKIELLNRFIKECNSYLENEGLRRRSMQPREYWQKEIIIAEAALLTLECQDNKEAAAKIISDYTDKEKIY